MFKAWGWLAGSGRAAGVAAEPPEVVVPAEIEQLPPGALLRAPAALAAEVRGAVEVAEPKPEPAAHE